MSIIIVISVVIG